METFITFFAAVLGIFVGAAVGLAVGTALFLIAVGYAVRFITRATGSEPISKLTDSVSDAADKLETLTRIIPVKGKDQ